MEMTAPEPPETKPMLDLRYTHATYRRGDIVAVFTWNRHTGDACLVLLPVNRPAMGFVPCVVQEQNAWIWSDTIGDIVEQERVSAEFACTLGLPPDPKSIHRVMSIIRDHVGDLISVPPMPEDAGAKVVAEVTSIDPETGAETHSAVIEHV